jgi:hypothetical protein
MSIELVDFYYNQKTNMVEVDFRVAEDSDDIIRQQEFDVDVILEYGYQVINLDDLSDSYSSYDDLEDYIFESEESDLEPSIDEYELKSFLIEYYSNNSDKLPDTEVF